jgi:hypothetical protein
MSRGSPGGLSGTPRDVYALLAEAAENAAQASTLLTTLVQTGDRNVVGELTWLEGEGDRISHELFRAVRRVRVAGADRGPLLDLTEALDDAVDAVEDAGHAVPDCECGGSGERLAGVIRDVARTQTKLIALLRTQGEHDDQYYVDTAHRLAEEGRSVVRAALADSVGEGIDPMVAMRQKLCFERLATALDAAVQAVYSTDRAISQL